jgi:hypothetical protein
MLAPAVIALGGCGNDRPKTIPINGLITIDGQPPGEFGKIFFTPTQAAQGYTKRAANGPYNEQGQYRVMTWEPDDGLVPGHYTVNLQPGADNKSKSRIPPKYLTSDTSGLEVDVPVDQDEVEFNVDIKTK